MGSFGGVKKNTRVQNTLPEPSEEELRLNELSVSAAEAQAQFIERQSALQEFLFQQAPELYAQLQREAGLGLDEDGNTNFQLNENLKNLVDEAIGHSLELGQSDIRAFRDEGLRNVRDVLAPSRGLRPEDSPILRAGADIVREAQRQQGDLVSSLRGVGAETALGLATEFQSQLRRAAFNNRLNLFGNSAQFGLASNAQFNIPQALSVIQQPRFQEKKTRVDDDTLSGGFTLSYGAGGAGGGGGAGVGGYTPVG